jgi:hypothetical protein
MASATTFFGKNMINPQKNRNCQRIKSSLGS